MSMSKVQAHYDDVADVYDQRYDVRQGRLYHHHLSQIALERLPDGGLLLDLGCGTGLFIDHYQKNGGSAVGLDISPGMVGMGRKRCPDSEFMVGTAEILPFADETFDSVASLLAFSYLTHPEATIRECHRILKPGGRIAVCTLSWNMLTRLVPVVYRIGERIGYQKVGFLDHRYSYYSEAELEALFSCAGFIDVESTRCSFAHYILPSWFFSLAQRCEPFVERHFPALAFNVCVSGRKEED